MFFGLQVFKTLAKQNYIDLSSINYDKFNTKESMTRTKRSLKNTLGIFNYLDMTKYFDRAIGITFIYHSTNFFKTNQYIEGIEEYKKLIKPLYKQVKKNKIWMKTKIRKFLNK